MQTFKFAFAAWRPSSGYTYQMRAGSILAALANALLLVAAIAIIAWEAIGRGEGAVHGRTPCRCHTAYSATTPLTETKITAAVINTDKRCSSPAYK